MLLQPLQILPLIFILTYMVTTGIAWTYLRTNGIDGTKGYDVMTYWMGKLIKSEHYSSISDLVTGAVDSVTFGISASNGSGASSKSIQFVSTRNENNIDFSKFFRKNEQIIKE